MNNRLLELEVMKILQEYKLLLLDEEYKNEIISLNKSDFLEEISKKGGFEETPKEDTNDLDSEDLNKDSDELDNSDEIENLEVELDEKTSLIKEGLKKLYRKIVKLTHPDKTLHKNNKKELSELYIRAKKAMATMDIYEILIICDKLDIEYSIDINHKEVLEENLIKKKKSLKELESSFLWVWINAETDEKKDAIVNLFIQKHKK